MLRHLLLGFAVSALWAQSVPEEAALHREHDALFATLLPLDPAQGDALTAASLGLVRDALWQRSRFSPLLQRFWTTFVDLRPFQKECALPRSLEDAGGDFARLQAMDREKVFSLLQSCANPQVRVTASTVRNFYVSKGYEAVQEQMTGVHIETAAPSEFVAAHTPQLPPSALRFDAAADEIVRAVGDFDVLIVGSGPAGSVLAHELRRDGKHVLLVERGPFVVPGAEETRLDEDLIDTRMSSNGMIRIRNGNAVGGGTQVNVDLCFAPTSPAVQAKIAQWRKDKRIGSDQFLPTEVATAYEWVKSHIGTRELAKSEINANNRVLWDGALKARLNPKLYALNTFKPGTSPSPVTDKRSAESQLLLEALQDVQNPLSLLTDAEVTRVLFRDVNGTPQAYGVELRTRTPLAKPGIMQDLNRMSLPAGRVLTVRAKTVILSAGALGSASILLDSGIANDNIGRGVVLHPSMPIMGSFEQNIDAMSGTQASVFVDDLLITRGYAFEAMSAPPSYAAVMSPGTPRHTYEMVRNFRHLAGFGVMLVDSPSSENRVRITQDGPVIDYSLSEQDSVRLREGIAQAIRMMFFAGAKQVYVPTMEQVLPGANTASVDAQVLTSPEQADSVALNLRFVSGRTLLSSAHMQSTNKMGDSPSSSVVGQDFHVWNTSNLYVVDSSVFPTSVGANPMQSIYTLAKIFVDHWNATTLTAGNTRPSGSD